MRFRLFLASLMLIPAASHAAGACTVRSGPNTAALLELYTSEGCDSCPPADRWLSTFAGAPGVGSLVVPIAFHVDYWDYLGWKDVYGEARHSERQRALARASGARAVYTPQVMVAGRDFPSWRIGSPAKAFEAVNARPARATLKISTESASSVRVAAALSPGIRAGDVALVVAITQDGLATQVKAGENRGATLRHDFVARDVKTFRDWKGEVPAIDTRATFSPRADWKPDRMRVVAFIQNLATGEVLQALSKPGTDPSSCLAER